MQLTETKTCAFALKVEARGNGADKYTDDGLGEQDIINAKNVGARFKHKYITNSLAFLLFMEVESMVPVWEKLLEEVTKAKQHIHNAITYGSVGSDEEDSSAFQPG